MKTLSALIGTLLGVSLIMGSGNALASSVQGNENAWINAYKQGSTASVAVAGHYNKLAQYYFYRHRPFFYPQYRGYYHYNYYPHYRYFYRPNYYPQYRYFYRGCYGGCGYRPFWRHRSWFW